MGIPFWLHALLQAAHTALALLPWTAIVSRLLERENPFPAGLMTAWMLAAAVCTWILHRRPRRIITHALVHLVTGGGLFLLWLARQRGIPLGGETLLWWRWLGQKENPLQGITELFWFLSWGLLWRRGVTIAQRPALERVQLQGEFALGLLSWALALLLSLASQLDASPLLPPLFLYFAIGLTWQGRSLKGAVLLSLFLTVGAAYGLLHVLLGAGDGFRAGVDGAAAVAGPWVIAFLRWLFDRPRPDPTPVESSLAVDVGPQGPMGGAGGETPWWLQGALWVFLGMLIVAALIGIGVGAVWLWRYLMGQVAVPGAQAWGGTGPSWLRDGWERIVRGLRWVRDQGRRAAAWLKRAGEAVTETLRPSTLPAAYRGLLRWGRLLGCPRRPWETPREYAQRLSASIPAAAPAIQSLTDAYMEFLYGFSPPEETGHGNPPIRQAYRALFHPRFLVAGPRLWWRRLTR